MKTNTDSPYIARVNLAIDFIMSHLEEPIRLEQVAQAAGFSAFHFHRVFQSLVGQTPTEFTKRRRLDKALTIMAFSKDRSLTDVALDCGFSNSSDFSRCFKQQFNVPPSQFDLETWRDAHRDQLNEVMQSKKLHVQGLPEFGKCDPFSVRLKNISPFTVAYIRVNNPYEGERVVRAAERLVHWAEERRVADGQWLGYQWENPETVPLEDCYYNIAVVADNVFAAGEVSCFQFPRMVVAEVEVRGSLELELQAWQWLYGHWLPRSGYVPDDQPCFEAWEGRPFAHGNSHFELRLRLPVK